MSTERARNRIVLVGGGVRCGKSAFALARARELGTRRLFVATAEESDAEMAERIARHRQERDPAFETCETPTEVEHAVAHACAEVVVVDCLTLWLSNLLLRHASENALTARVDALCAVLAARPRHCVLVSNEVGMGLVPESALGRRFRDLSGLLHQRVAALADEIYVGVLGCMLRLRPAPIGLLAKGERDVLPLG